jgi:hypothetical protein
MRRAQVGALRQSVKGRAPNLEGIRLRDQLPLAAPPLGPSSRDPVSQVRFQVTGVELGSPAILDARACAHNA